MKHSFMSSAGKHWPGLALVLLGLLLTAILPARPAEALTISPIRLELEADPGQTVAASFKVFNDLPQAQTYYITFARFETKDETGEPAFIPGGGGLPSWVEAPSSIVAPSREFLTVPFKINVPSGVDPGGYFAAIFASTVQPNQQNGNDIAVRGDVGTLILFRVKGDFKEGETVLEFNTNNKQYWYSSLPVEFYYRFQNTGEDRAKPLGDITIKNLFGMTSKLVNANRSAGNTLPKSIRRYDAAWVTSGGDKVEGNLAPPQHLASNASWVQTLKWQWQHFALGRYTANLQVTVNNDTSRSYASHTAFWVIPWQLLLTIGAGLAILFGGATLLALLVFWLVFRRRNRKQ